MNKGPLLIFSCYILWGILPIYWKLLQSVNAYFILGNRIFWSFIFALILIVGKGQLLRLKGAFNNRTERRKLLAAGIFCVLNWGSYIVAVNTNHIVDASLAYFMNPILAIILAAVIFKERLAPLQWLGVAFAFFGVAISIIAYGQVPWLALIIGGTFAIYGAIQKTCHIDGVTALGAEMLWFLPPTVLLSLWAIQGDALGTISIWQWILLPTTGIITAGPLMLYAIGISSTDYALSGILMYINPTLQLLCGVILYEESLSQAQLLMFIFVWVGLVLYLFSTLYKRFNRKNCFNDLKSRDI